METSNEFIISDRHGWLSPEGMAIKVVIKAFCDSLDRLGVHCSEASYVVLEPAAIISKIMAIF